MKISMCVSAKHNSSTPKFPSLERDMNLQSHSKVSKVLRTVRHHRAMRQLKPARLSLRWSHRVCTHGTLTVIHTHDRTAVTSEIIWSSPYLDGIQIPRREAHGVALYARSK